MTASAAVYRASWQKTRRAHNRSILLDTLGGECVRCGSVDKLHFDHIDPSSKKFDIATRLSCSIDLLLREAAKCQILCSSCHGKKTATDNGRSSPTHGTLSMYVNAKCRCDLCKTANAYYYKGKRK